MPLQVNMSDMKKVLESADGASQLTIADGGTVQYVLPNTAGTEGQVLKASATPATLEWGAAGGTTTDFDDLTTRTLNLKDASGDAITLQTDTAISAAYTLTFPGSQGSSKSVVVNDGSGVLSWGLTSTLLPKRWEFGRQRFKWEVGMSTTGFTFAGEAALSTSTEDHSVQLTPATNDKYGRFYYDFGTAPSITDWEMQIVLKSGPGADGFHVFANSSISGSFFFSNPSYRMTNLSNVSASGGHTLFINEYDTANNYFVKLYDGSSNIATQVAKPTDLNNGKPQKISFRKIGTTLTVQLLDYGGSNCGRFLYQGTTTSTPNGRYWGIAAFTGVTNTYHNIYSIELRSLDQDGDLSTES